MSNPLDKILKEELINRHGRFKGALLSTDLAKDIIKKISNSKPKDLNKVDTSKQELASELLTDQKHARIMIKARIEKLTCMEDVIKTSMMKLLERAQNKEHVRNILIFFTSLTGNIKQVCQIEEEVVKKFIENIKFRDEDYTKITTSFIHKNKSRKSSVKPETTRRKSSVKPDTLPIRKSSLKPDTLPIRKSTPFRLTVDKPLTQSRKSSIEILKEYGLI